MKKLFLILLVLVTFTACLGGGDAYDIKYVNQTGVDIYIKGWRWWRMHDTATDEVELDRAETTLRCIENGKTYVFSTCPGCDCERGYLDLDTVLIRFGSEREIIYGYNEAGTPAKMENYDFIPKSRFKGVDAYVFTFTREMYDAATPIDQPAEE